MGGKLMNRKLAKTFMEAVMQTKASKITIKISE